MTKIFSPLILRAFVFACLMLLATACSKGGAQAEPMYSMEKAEAVGVRPVTQNFAVSPQINADDLQAIADAGFTRIINHLPDGESPGQTNSADMAAEAKRLGIKFVNLPFSPGRLDQETFDDLIHEMDASNEPTLSYCRSGTRAITIWSMSQVKTGHMSPDEAIAAAGHAGYRLRGHKKVLQNLADGKK